MPPDIHALAHVARAGPWTLDALTGRLAECRGWLGPEEIGWTAAALLGRWRTTPKTAPARFLADLAIVVAARPGRRIPVPELAPRWRWPVPEWSDLDALAVGLDLRAGELSWFADPGGWLVRAPDGPLHHYRRHWVTSRSGGLRLLEAPGPRLQELQRRVDRKVLRPIPVHPAAHGFVRGRSPRTFAAAHRGMPLVLRLDLEGFFAHVSGGRVAGLLRTAGYPAAVAAALAGLVVTATPHVVLRTAPAAPSDGGWEPRRRLLARLAGPHLPQGAPTSPAVVNLLAHRLDRRLTGLAAAVGATYARYADDLVFSGQDLPAHGLCARVAAIAAEEGFRVRPDKTRVMPAHHRQVVTGLVVNDSPGVGRRDYDAQRALLRNCARTGPAAQDHDGHPAFRDHLLGRIAWVGTGRPARRARLLDLFAAIGW